MTVALMSVPPPPLQSQVAPDTMNETASRRLTTDPDGVAFAPFMLQSPLTNDPIRLRALASSKLGKLIAPALLMLTGAEDPPLDVVLEKV